MFLGDLMLQARCSGTLRKQGRCGGEESDGGKRDDRRLHFSVLPWNESPRGASLKLDPFREPDTSRSGDGVAFHASCFEDVGGLPNLGKEL